MLLVGASIRDRSRVDGGSNPTPAIHWHIVQRSERLPVKQDVAGSNPAMPV